jgi:hypothetical protein
VGQRRGTFAPNGRWRPSHAVTTFVFPHEFAGREQGASRAYSLMSTFRELSTFSAIDLKRLKMLFLREMTRVSK